MTAVLHSCGNNFHANCLLLTGTDADAQRNSIVLLPKHESDYFRRTLRSHLHWPIFKDVWFS